MTERTRIIQESVPGRQITLAHIISNPDKNVYDKVGLKAYEHHALGILTITPGEAAIIAADIAEKAGDVKVAFMDRFSGAVVLAGDVMSVESSIHAVNDTLFDMLNIAKAKITKN